MTKGGETRNRILDAAHEAVVAKGFGATSIDELLAVTGISKSGFFYHFRDKTELAKALIERYFAEDERIYDALFARARDLVDDPLQVFLLTLRFLADAMADLPRGHPGCLVALSCYHERQFDASVRDLNREGALMWRRRFRAMFDEIAGSHPPRTAIDGDDFADMISSVLEGGIVMSKALEDPAVLPRQILMLRTFVRLAFQAGTT
ncbi:MAG: TetR/AcrR family transcriptional regulator [Rhodobacteraceae bacterium]|jgi:AcrR family transcriptional regulator|nr:TetR/AcrR family transcriptional regulator [Paracoccaceae bacterium]